MDLFHDGKKVPRVGWTSANNKVYRRNVWFGRLFARKDEWNERVRSTQKRIDVEGGGWHARRGVLWAGMAKKYHRGNATVLGGTTETTRLLVLATITTVPRVLQLLYIVRWLHWSHRNAVKTKKNRCIPCSVTVTTLHQQLVTRACLCAFESACAFVSHRETRTIEWKTRSTWYYAHVHYCSKVLHDL